MLIHGPSLGIGAAIASAALILVILSFNMFEEPELTLEPSKEQGPAKVTISTFTDNGSSVLGSVYAPITMVEFGDYQCFHCNKFFHETEESILKNYVDTGKVKIIFKDFTIIGPDSVAASNASHCADDQGFFWQYHDTLYNNWTGENNGWASSENLHKFANNIGLEMNEFSKCMAESKHQSKIEKSNQDAKDLGIEGTPAFFIIGPDNKISSVSGSQPFDVFKKIFDSELEK
jgi:protein-disulfide isomerase